MHGDILKNLELILLYKEYEILKHPSSNYQYRRVLEVDDYTEGEKKSRFRELKLFDMDKLL